MSKNDAGLPSRSSSMRPPPDPAFRFPLMTPSASPPVQRSFGRQSDGPSSIKKRRVSRTPSLLGPGARSYSVVSASSSSVSPAFPLDTAVDPGEDLHVARRASSFRVLNVWSQLADKYTRRLDEDDIVDLEKETIIKDYGVLRSSNDTFEIGCFADEHEKAERLDNGQPLTPVDDEPDELDAFAEIRDTTSRSETDGDDDDGLELAQRSKRLPPVREVDPADAADLAEFLKAEQSRKEMFGDPDDDEGDQYEEDDDEFAEEGETGEIEAQEEGEGKGENLDVDTAVSRSDTEGDSTGRDAHSSGAEEVVYQESVHDDVRNNNEDYRRTSTPSGSPEFDILDISYVEKDSDTEEAIISNISVDDDAQVVAQDSLAVASDENSEDELGGWQHDEGSTLYSVGDFSEGSADEGECESSKEHTSTPTPDPPTLSRNGKTRPRQTPVKKVQLVPEVYIDGPSRSLSRKLSKAELALDNHLDFPANPVSQQKSAKARGKARATEGDDYTSVYEIDREIRSTSPDVPDFPASTRSHRSRQDSQMESPIRLSSAGNKRRRAYSPARDDPSNVDDVVMASPPRPSSRTASRRSSYSRRSVVDKIDSHDEREAGPNSRASASRRSRSHPSREQLLENTSRPQLPPELSSFSFTTPHTSSAGIQNYGGGHFPPPLVQQQPSVPLPNIQDTNAQYYLAQVLQSLSFLMGGSLPFPPSPATGSHAPPPSLGQNVDQPWPPYTPRHRDRFTNVDTPQSAASAPPASSPVGSDYSESVPSSPTKQPVQARGRPRTQSRGLKIGRPKSAIRESKMPSRSRLRGQRRVSFSSPEATHIEDHAYDFGSDNLIEVESSNAEDSDVESRRLRRETQSKRSLQLQSQPRRHARAQTPAPPGPSSTLECNEDHPRPMHSDSRTKKRDAMGGEDARTPGSISDASHNVNRKIKKRNR